MPSDVLRRTEITIDVSADLPFDEPAHVAASVHLPRADGEAPRAVLVCWPGGSYSRAYWDMHVDGHEGYSFADHLTAEGFLVVAADHLGVGASSKPVDGDQVGFETMSAAAASFVEQVRTMLSSGSARWTGGGLPRGASLPAVTQARHRSYDALALLGFTHGRKDVSVTAVGASEREAPDDTAARAIAI